MAGELDAKLLKSLDDRIRSMNADLLQLSSTVGVLAKDSKNVISGLFREFSSKSLSDLLKVDDATQRVKTLNEEIKTLQRNLKLGGNASLVRDEATGKKYWRVSRSAEYTDEQQRAAINRLAEARKELHNLMLSDEQIMRRTLSIIRQMSSSLTPQQKALQQQQDAYRKILNIQQEIQRIRNRQSERGARGLVVDKATVDAEVALIKRLEAEIRVLKRERTALSKESGVSNSTKLSKGDYAKSLEYQRQLTKETVRHGEALERIKKHQREVKNGFEQMLPTLRRLASAFGVVFSVQGLVQFGKKLIETRGEFELQQVALRSILQNKQLADEIWDKTMQAALQSPFTAMQLTKYTKQLAAYRIETDKLFDTTKRLADVSAGLGVDMQRLILAYGQVKAANYLRASEIRQFTEAGVNVLGELSDYFARTRGEMVSTAQVMEMVQKRMVKFEDVEAIFKHMTDEGGIFYNMQYIQSQTVRGQINKLHDAYDQMLNSIGQGNQGVLKNMVSIANNLVRNWREVAGTIQGIAWAFIFVQLGKIAIGIHRIGTEAITSGSKVSWLARQLGKLREKSKGYEFGKVFSKANVVLAAGAAVAFVTGKFIQHLNAVRQLNEKYNELSLRAYETQENLSGIQKTLSQNNQNIERLNKVSKKSKEQEEELANARKQNAEIVNRLKRDYPELADGMNIQKNGVVTLTSAISDYNEQLEYTILLNQLAKGNTWNDDFQTNVTEMTQSLQSAEQTLASYQSLAKSILLQMKNMDFGFREKSQAKGLKELLEGIIGLEKGDYEGLNKLLSGNRLSGYNRFTQTRSWRTAFQPILLDEHNIKATKKQLERSESVLYDLLKNSVRRDKEYMTEISKEWGGDIDKFIHNNAERIQKNVDDGKKDTFKAIREYGLQMGFAFKGAQDIFNQTLNRGNTSLFGGLGFRFFEYPGVGETGTDQETPEEKRAKVDAAWRRRIQLLEEMKRRYDELSKAAYGYAKSEMTVRQAFDDVRDANGNVIEKGAFSTIFAGTGITMDQIDFTSMEGMFKSMRLALQQAKGISDAVRDEIMKKIDSYEAQITINAQVKIREDFDKEMEKMFSDYELTLDLKKLSLPTGELEGIFDFDLTTIDALRKAVDTFYNEQKRLGADPTDLTKQVEGYYKKIDDMERKALLERLKTYTEYLTQGRDKAVQIHLDELNKMAEIDELYYKRHYSLEQYRGISSQIKRDTEKKLQENEWREFKESDFYTTMFEDLDHVATSSIDLMISELKKLQKNLNNLDPTQVKEIVKAIDNLEKRKRSRSPLKSFVEDFKTMLRWQKERDGYENALAPKLALKDILEERYKRDVLSVAKAEQEYNKLALDGLEGNEAEAKKYWDERLAALNLTKEQLEQVKDEIAEINEKNNEGYGAWVRTYQGISRGAQYFSEMASAAGTIATEMMDMFDGVEDASKKLASDIADIAGNTAALGGDIAKAIASEGSDVGSMIDGLVRTWNIIKGIFSASEADINRTVERETEKLEILEHSLDRVKRARDRAWDTAKIIESEKETEKAINDMIASYRALIAAEQARKNPDENNIRQWMNEIEQLYEQLEEEREDFIGKFGGIGESGYLSAAEGFVEAWKSAFLETGDGLQGLQDHFDEFLQDWFVKQATMRIASRMLQPMFDSIDKAVDENSDGGVAVTMRELDALREWADVNFPLISDNLEDLAGMFGVGGEGGLSGLAAGIQGMTEEQANILEAYWNSVRMYTASIDMNVSRIAEMLGAGGPNTNPMLAQLQTIADNTGYIKDIYKMLDGTRRNLGNGQGFITYNQ